MSFKRYTSAGLVIESAFDLPGLNSAQMTDGPAQLRYLYSEAGQQPDLESLRVGVNWSEDRTTLSFYVPDVAVFEISATGVVVVAPQTANLNEIAAYLIGSVLGIALHMRRVVTLHASAVKVGDGAALFCGDSGAGKSTIAAALQQRGYQVLSDDLCAIDISRDIAVVHSDGRKLKLWEDALKKLGLAKLRGDRVQQDYDKYFLANDFVKASKAPVCAIFELVQIGEENSPRVTKVPAAEAAAMIRRNAYRPFLVEQLEDEKLYFDAASSLLLCSSVLRLERPRRFDQIDQVVEVLEDCWRAPPDQ